MKQDSLLPGLQSHSALILLKDISLSIVLCGEPIRLLLLRLMDIDRLVRNIRDIETALGDGVKKVYESELGAIKEITKVK